MENQRGPSFPLDGILYSSTGVTLERGSVSKIHIDECHDLDTLTFIKSKVILSRSISYPILSLRVVFGCNGDVFG